MTSPGDENLRLEADAVLLDLDGLLIDSEPAAYDAARAILGEEGVLLHRDEFSAQVGRSTRELYTEFVDRFALRASVEDLLQRRDARLARFYSAPAPMPGAIRFVRTLAARGVVVGVASSSDVSLVDRAVDALGLRDDVAVVVGWGDPDVAAPKPSPDLFLVALGRLGVSAAAAVGVEDSPTGAMASMAAGLTTVVVPNEWTRSQAFPEHALKARSLAHLDVHHRAPG